MTVHHPSTPDLIILLYRLTRLGPQEQLDNLDYACLEQSSKYLDEHPHRTAKLVRALFSFGLGNQVSELVQWPSFL